MKTSDPIVVRGGSRLHPISVISFIGKSVKDLFYPFIAFFVSTIMRDGQHGLWLGGGIIVFLLLLITLSWLTWYRFVYVIEPNNLYVEYGVFVRKKLWIPKDRVQSVDTTAGIVHRLFGLIKLQVETAGGKKPEAVLNAITLEEADRIRAAFGLISSVPPSAPEAPSEPPELKDRITVPLRDLVMFSATSGRIGIVIALMGAAYSQLDEWLVRTFDIWGFIVSWFDSSRIGWMIALLVVIAWALAVIVTVVKEYGFTLHVNGDKLIIERGLLERKQMTVPLHRIQSVHLIENALRRPFGFVSVQIVTAGMAGKEGLSVLLFPLLRKKDLPAFLKRFTPQFQLAGNWQHAGKQSLSSFMTLPLVISIAAIIPAIIWVPYHFGWLALLLPLFTGIRFFLSCKHTAWSIRERQLSIQFGGFNKHQALIPRNLIQWNRLSQTPLQRRKKRATFTVALASGIAPTLFSIRHLPETDGFSLKHWLSYKNRQG